jgi:hypothetical protein
MEREQAPSRDLKRRRPGVFPYFAKPYLESQRGGFRKALIIVRTDAGYPGMLRHDFRRTAVGNMVNRSIPGVGSP